MKVASMSIRVVTGFVLALLAVVQGQAHERSEAVMELHNELREYARTEMAPTMDQWKQTIDATLSADDLARLNEMRAQAAEHMAARKERMEEFKNMSEEERRELREEMRERHEEMRAKHGEMMSFFKDLTEITARYPDLVQQIKQEGESQKAAMKAGALSIVQDWENEHATEIAAAGEHAQARLDHLKARLGDESVEAPACRNSAGSEKMPKKCEAEVNVEEGRMMRHPRHGRHHGGPHGMGLESLQGPRALAMVFFWNGQAEELFGGDYQQNGFNSTDDGLLREGLGLDDAAIDVYPNPAVNQATISIDLPQSDNVVIFLLDTSGREVARLFEGQLSAGEHEFAVDGNKYNLNSGVYHFRVVGQNGAQSGQFVLTR